ncbi:MAG: hypothetical protein ACK419_06175 [Pyrinomonadaceae bacterium]
MVEEEHSEDSDPDVAYLKAKANTSAVKTIEAILETPKMKRLIRKTFVKEGLLQGFIMAFIFVGLMMVYNAVKAALNFGWQIDLAAGYFLILVGALYLWRKIRAK